MGVNQNNTVNTGLHGSETGKDPLEACLPLSSGLFKGIQPFGIFAGTQDMQGTFGADKWRASDWVINYIGGTGVTLVPQAGQPAIGKFSTRGTTDGDGYNLQWSMDGGTTIHEIFKPLAGTVIVGYARFKVDNSSTDAHTKSRWYFGIGDADTDIHGSVLNFVGFYKASGAATMVGVLDASSQTLTSALTDSLVDNTYIQLGFRINGTTSVEFWQGSGVKPGSMRRVTTQTTVTNLPTANMALSFQGETSEGVAVDYYLQHMIAFQEAI